MPSGVQVSLNNFRRLFSPYNIFISGPAALDIAWVGAGSADAFYHGGLHCWDMAAGALIVREAGGYVASLDGSEFDLMSRSIVVAATKKLADELVDTIQKYQPPPEFEEKVFA